MKRICPGILFLLLLLLCAPPAFAWRGTVVRVQDGDSLLIRPEGADNPVRIRLHGVDAPERGYAGRWEAQPYSTRAQRFLAELLPPGTSVAVAEYGQDRYGRVLAGVVRLPDGLVVQEELLREGLAWVFRRYCKGCGGFEALERSAKEAGRGLWGENAAVPPWEWRRQKGRESLPDKDMRQAVQ